MTEREIQKITERRYDDDNNLKYVVVTYEVKEKDDEVILIKQDERDWDPEKDD